MLVDVAMMTMAQSNENNKILVALKGEHASKQNTTGTS